MIVLMLGCFRRVNCNLYLYVLGGLFGKITAACFFAFCVLPFPTTDSTELNLLTRHSSGKCGGVCPFVIAPFATFEANWSSLIDRKLGWSERLIPNLGESCILAGL